MDKRVENLRGHFAQASKDIDEIQTSAKKITGRAAKIEAVELADVDPVDAISGSGSTEPVQRPTLVANGD